jgi:DNA-binding response OmpR family regulator
MHCINFTVTFPEWQSASSNIALAPFILGGLSVLILIGIVYWFYTRHNKTEIDTALQNNEPVDNTHLIKIGKSVFNTRQNTVIFNEISQKLTFREAKLLQLFCNHKQELLERDFILKHIWEDEGVLVGRSVDVFVSRLRKILKNDETLKIVNVHSRGYRFDIDEAIA